MSNPGAMVVLVVLVGFLETLRGFFYRPPVSPATEAAGGWKRFPGRVAEEKPAHSPRRRPVCGGGKDGLGCWGRRGGCCHYL